MFLGPWLAGIESGHVVIKKLIANLMILGPGRTGAESGQFLLKV